MTISFSANNFVKPNTLHNARPVKSEEKPSSDQRHVRDILDLPKGYTITPDCKAAGKISPIGLFDAQYHGGVELSDGSRLLRPVILSLGRVDIKPTGNEEEYEVTFETGKQKVMKEDELVTNRVLSRGRIKETGDGKYNIKFIDNDGVGHSYTASKKGALTVLRDNLLYM